jgi:hypothetical protein
MSAVFFPVLLFGFDAMLVRDLEFVSTFFGLGRHI